MQQSGDYFFQPKAFFSQRGVGLVSVCELVSVPVTDWLQAHQAVFDGILFHMRAIGVSPHTKFENSTLRLEPGMLHAVHELLGRKGQSDSRRLPL